MCEFLDAEVNPLLWCFSRIPEFKSPEKSDFPEGDFRILSESITFVLENEQFLCGLYFLPYTL